MEQHMLNEKYNRPSWRSALDELDSLPGEEKTGYDISWDKLNARLHTNKKTKKSVYIWIAAASFSVLFFIAVFLSTSKKPVVNSVANNIINQKVESPISSIEKKEDVSKKVAFTENSASGVTKETIQPFKKIKNKTNQIVDENIPANIVANKSTVAVIENDSSKIITPQTALPLVKSKQIIFPALKKQMPVIHINEIEKDIRPAEAVAGNDTHRGLRIRFFSGDNTNRNEEQVSYQEGGLKIKLSPQN